MSDLVAWVGIRVLVRADDQWEAEEAARILEREIARDSDMVVKVEAFVEGVHRDG